MHIRKRLKKTKFKKIKKTKFKRKKINFEMTELSAYELQRLETMKKNREVLVQLGLEEAVADMRPPKRRKRKVSSNVDSNMDSNVDSSNVDSNVDSTNVIESKACLTDADFKKEERVTKQEARNEKRRKMEIKKIKKEREPSYVMQLEQREYKHFAELVGNDMKRQDAKQDAKQDAQYAKQEKEIKQNVYICKSDRPYSVKGESRRAHCPLCNGLYVRKKDGNFPLHFNNSMRCIPDKSLTMQMPTMQSLATRASPEISDEYILSMLLS